MGSVSGEPALSGERGLKPGEPAMRERAARRRNVSETAEAVQRLHLAGPS
jgi:hypothetical protein